MSCQKPNPVTRRDALRKIGGGFAMMSFASLIGESLAKAEALDKESPGSVAADAAHGEALYAARSELQAKGKTRHLPFL